MGMMVPDKCLHRRFNYLGGNQTTTAPEIGATADIPRQVFEKFLEALGDSDVSPKLIARLRKTLLEDQTFTDPALKAAVLGEEETL
jgi:hypothetical protein